MTAFVRTTIVEREHMIVRRAKHGHVAARGAHHACAESRNHIEAADIQPDAQGQPRRCTAHVTPIPADEAFIHILLEARPTPAGRHDALSHLLERHELVTGGALLRALRPRIDLRMFLRLHESRVERRTARRVVHHALLHVRKAHSFDPRRRAFEILRLFAIDLHESATVFHHLLFRLHLAQEIGRAHLHAAVAADVQFVTRIHAHHAEVLDGRLGAVARTAGHRHLELVRCPRTPTHLFEFDTEAGGVLCDEAAPFCTDAGLYRAQRFAVGVARNAAGAIEIAPHARRGFFFYTQ